MGNVQAIKAHEIPSRAALRIARGESVTIGERDTTWPAFVYVTAAHGDGWVPARYLDGGSGPATVLAPYDTTELPTEQGEILTVITRDDESGWLWLRDADGRQGWVPAETVEDLP
jgi:SH3-like domain-containing protein